MPVVATSLRARLKLAALGVLPPTPLPARLPADPAVQQRAILAAAGYMPWTDEEVRRIEQYPDLVGLAWAFGVDHPCMCTMVESSPTAAVAALCAGVPAPDLVARVITGPDIWSDRAARHQLVDACEPFPALWRQITAEPQSNILRRYRWLPAYMDGSG